VLEAEVEVDDIAGRIEVFGKMFEVVEERQILPAVGRLGSNLSVRQSGLD